MNAWSKLLVLMILLTAGWVGYRTSAGVWKAWLDQPLVLPASIDASVLGSSLVEADSVSGVGGDTSFDAAPARKAGADQSTFPALAHLRHQCSAWLRKLGYAESVERDSNQ